MRKLLNLQRFADDDTPPIDVDVNVGDGLDDDDKDPEFDVTPDDSAITPPNNPPALSMPSGVSEEAWRNVEELFVTLSNNFRVGMAEMQEQVKNMKAEQLESSKEVNSALSRLGITMDEFKALLETAVIEDDGKGKPNDEPKTERKRSGYLKKKGR